MNKLLRALFACLDNSPTERGMRLLKSQLTPAQLRQYEEFGWFDVIGGDTGHRFRIYRGDALNVDEYDSTGRCVFRWCIRWCFMPTGNLMRGDVLLAQKLALELFESDARSVANIYPSARPQGVYAWSRDRRTDASH